MLKREKIFTNRKWLNGILLSTYLIFLTVSIFHVHHFHFHTENCKIELQSASKNSVGPYALEDLSSGCYITNYTNTMYNLDNNVIYRLTLIAPPEISTSNTTPFTPLLSIIHVSYLRGPPLSEKI